MTREDWLNSLKSDTEPPRYPEIDAKIRQIIEDKGSITPVEGALGDSQDMTAYVEGLIYPPEGGVFTRYIGIKQLFRGYVDSKIVDAIAQIKRVLMADVEMIMESKVWFLPFLFWPEKRMWDLVKRTTKVFQANLAPKLPPYSKFSEYSRELIETFCDIFKLPYVLNSDHPEVEGKNLLIHYLIKCVVSFFEFDFAYSSVLRDVLGEADKENGIKHPIREVRRLFNLAISRDRYTIKTKFAILRDAATIILVLSPSARCLAKQFFARIKLERIRRKGDDWYYHLRRHGYDFGGISYEERAKQAEEIDKESGNIILGI